jgi:uncharacterized protein YndB with AHSA1/START domain
MRKGLPMAVKSKSNEIKFTRVYDAPVRLVWDAWTDVEQVKQWWGPRGFTLTSHSKDLRPGGIWHYTMHGPDGTDYPNKTLYHEVKECARLVYDHGGYDDRPPLFRVTVNFSEHKGKTTMDMTMSFPSPEAAAEIGKFIKQASGYSTWDRLGEYLDKEATGKEIFIINRSFDAPQELMYDLWTKPEHISQWLPPNGFTMKYMRPELRVGGNSFYEMTNGAITMYGHIKYLEMNRPNSIVYTQEFCDKDEKPARHPLAPTWPAQMRTTVSFTAESASSTRVTVRWEVVGDVTKEEMDTFIKGRAGMTQGWTGSFDKLDSYIAEQA